MTTHSRGVWIPPKPKSVLTDRFDSVKADSVSAPKPARRREVARRAAFTRLTLGITSGWMISQIALPAHAASLINNSGIQFEEETTLESSFVESHGAYQSTFGVINLDTKEKTPLLIETRASDAPETIFKPSSRRSHLGTNTDFRGTPGNAVPKPIAQYRFQANQRYVMYLESTFKGRPTGIVYSTDVLNPNREQQVEFAGGINDLCTSGIKVGWDDTGARLVRNRQQQDRDFDDFVVQMRSLSCGMGGGEPTEVKAAAPEPAPPVAPASRRSGSLLWAAPLALLPFLFRTGGGGGGTPKVVPPGNPGIVPPGIPGTPGTPGIPPAPPVPPPSCPGGGNCEPVPEPLTILGSGSAIAFATMMQRRRNRKKK